MKKQLPGWAVLLIITLVAGLALGGTYALTKDPIAEQALLQAEAARKAALPEADTFQALTLAEGAPVDWANAGLQSAKGKAVPLTLGDIDAIAGATITSTAVVDAINAAYEKYKAAPSDAAFTGEAQGFASPVQVTATFDGDTISTLTIGDGRFAETAGLGARAQESAFVDQFTAGEKVVGYVSQITVKGYKGPVEVTVGLDPDLVLTGISVGGSDFAETAGLGAKAKEPAFQSQFAGKKTPVSVIKTGGTPGDNTVDAITAATITSNAVRDAVNTVAKYASKGDFSPEPPVARPRTSPTMEPYARAVRSWLEGDRDRPRRQRHTARRVYDRLVSELGYGGSLATVERFVREWRREHAHGPSEGFLELEWPCGTCQVDYGHASAVVAGEEVELHELAVSWPHSNARFCVMCESERGECLVDGLMTVFDHVGGVPPEAVLDNATEAGRRVAGVVRESSLFSAFRAHTGMRTKYCNPHSGHEKGSVENAVGFLRRNMMVPLPVASTVSELNAHLLARCDALLAEPHYRTGRPVCDMFAEDQSAMLPLPATRFDAVRWVPRTADRDGRVEVDGVLYLAGPSWRGWRLLVGLRARSVEVVDGRGRHVFGDHRRAGRRRGARHAGRGRSAHRRDGDSAL